MYNFILLTIYFICLLLIKFNLYSILYHECQKLSTHTVYMYYLSLCIVLTYLKYLNSRYMAERIFFRKGAPVVLHYLLPLMNSFNKTETAAYLHTRAMLNENVPVSSVKCVTIYRFSF